MNWHVRQPARAILWSFILALAALVVLFTVLKKTHETQPVRRENPIPVVTVTLHAERIPDITTLPAVIEPSADATLAAEKAGRITSVLVEKGDRVQAGQTVLRIDDRSEQAAMQRAEIELREARKELRRREELQKSGAVSVSDLEAVQTRCDVAEIACRVAQINLSQCSISSPIAGVVNDRFVEPGEYVGAGDRALRMVCLDPVKVALSLPERDIGWAATGKTAIFTVDAIPGDVFTGIVTYVAAAASRESNAFATEITAPNPHHRLKAGMIAKVEISRRPAEPAIAVPLAAVVPKRGQHVVYVCQDGLAEERVVRISDIRGDRVVLSSGLQDGDELVIEGMRALTDGHTVSARPAAMPAPARTEP